MDQLNLNPEISLSIAAILIITAIAVFKVYSKYVNHL